MPVAGSGLGHDMMMKALEGDIQAQHQLITALKPELLSIARDELKVADSKLISVALEYVEKQAEEQFNSYILRGFHSFQIQLRRLLYFSLAKQKVNCVGVLLETYRPHLQRIVSRRNVNRTFRPIGSMTLSSDVIIKACVKFDQFRGNNLGALWNWLKTITLRDYEKSIEKETDQATKQNRKLRIQASKSSPLSSDIKKEWSNHFRTSVAKAFCKLSRKRRMIFRMRVWDELPYKEIGAKLGITDVHARVEFYEASKKLALLLEQYKDKGTN